MQDITFPLISFFMLHKLGFRTWNKRNEGISAQGFDTLLKNADKSA